MSQQDVSAVTDPASEPLFELRVAEDATLVADLDVLRDSGPAVQAVRYHGAIAYVVLGYDALDRIFKDDATLGGNSWFKLFGEPIYGPVVSTLDGEEHRFQRRQLMAAFKPGSIRASAETAIRPVANALIDALPEGEPFDFISSYAVPKTFDVVSSMLGIPKEDWAHFRGNVFQFLLIDNPEAALAAKALLTDYLVELIEKRRRDPGTDMISQLLDAETDGRRFTADELLTNIRFLYPAAIHNTANGIGLCLHEVLADEAVRERVATNWKDRFAAVDETLRLVSPLPTTARYTEHPITIEGVEIPAGTEVMLAISSANRDPRRYPDPGRFSLDRHHTDHFSFGRGAYLCLGQHLARAEMQVMLELVLGRLEGLRLVEDPDNVAKGFFHGFRRLLVQFDRRVPSV